jgi:hypothetical protein
MEDNQHNQNNQHNQRTNDIIITYICPICNIQPYSHSFTYLGIYNSIIYLYTCPEKALRYDDKDGILQHYNGILQNIQGHNWIWFFDATNFSQKHYFQIITSIELAKMITRPENSNTLQGILIYNPTWHLDLTLKIVKPFLSTNIKNIITKIQNIPVFLRGHSVFVER